MFTNATAFSTENYSKLLIAVEATNSNSRIRLDVESGLGSNVSTEAAAARARLRSDHNWTIEDGTTP